jgi:hypothetical protein
MKIDLNYKGEFLTSFGYIIKSIARIGEHSSDVFKNLINDFIG